MEAGVKFTTRHGRPKLRLVTKVEAPEQTDSDLSEPLPTRHEAPLHPANVARHGLSSAMADARRRLAHNKQS